MRNVRSKKCTRRSTRRASRHTRSWKIARMSCSSKGKMGSTGRSCESKLSSQTTGPTEERNTAALAARRSGYQTSGSVALLGVALPSGHVPQTKAHRCIRALRAPHNGDLRSAGTEVATTRERNSKVSREILVAGRLECVVLTRTDVSAPTGVTGTCTRARSSSQRFLFHVPELFFLFSPLPRHVVVPALPFFWGCAPTLLPLLLLVDVFPAVPCPSSSRSSLRLCFCVSSFRPLGISALLRSVDLPLISKEFFPVVALWVYVQFFCFCSVRTPDKFRNFFLRNFDMSNMSTPLAREKLQHPHIVAELRVPLLGRHWRQALHLLMTTVSISGHGSSANPPAQENTTHSDTQDRGKYKRSTPYLPDPRAHCPNTRFEKKVVNRHNPQSAEVALQHRDHGGDGNSKNLRRATRSAGW